MLSREWETNSMKFQFYIPQTFRGMLGYALQSKRKIIKFYTEGRATLVSIFTLWGGLFQHYRDCCSHFTAGHKFWEQSGVWKSTAVGPGCDVKVVSLVQHLTSYGIGGIGIGDGKQCYEGIMTNSRGKKSPFRIFPLPNPASACFFPQVLIIHKYHWLPTPTPSQGLPPGNPGCSRTQREFPLCAWREKDSVPNTQHRFYYTVCCFLIPDFSGPPPSSVFWENSVCLIRSTLESFLSSVFLCCLSSSLLLVLAIMVIAIS